MLFNRREALQKSGEAMARYRIALGILTDLGIDQLLLSACAVDVIDSTDDNALTANALQNQRVLGYRQAITDLFTLDALPGEEGAVIPPDYGAGERLVADGICTQEELDRYINEH